MRATDREDRAAGPVGARNDIAEGRELGDVTTLRDPSVVEALAARIAEDEA